MKHYYAGYNSYGTKTLNAWRVLSFDSLEERDQYVQSDSSQAEPTREALTAKEARAKIANKNASADDDTMINLGFEI